MEFILIVKSKGIEPSPNEMQELLQNYVPWMEKYVSAGNYLAGSPFKNEGALLIEKGEHIVEGDFLNGKNLITGYIHLKAESLEKAIDIADDCPLLSYNDIVAMPILEMK